MRCADLCPVHMCRYLKFGEIFPGLCGQACDTLLNKRATLRTLVMSPCLSAAVRLKRELCVTENFFLCTLVLQSSG